MLQQLEGAVDLVLSPSSHPASHASTVVELVAKLILAGRQASRVHIWLVQVNVTVGVQDGNVVAQSSLIELRVLETPDNIVLIMPAGFWGVEATGVILTNTDLQHPEGIACQKETFKE